MRGLLPWILCILFVAAGCTHELPDADMQAGGTRKIDVDAVIAGCAVTGSKSAVADGISDDRSIGNISAALYDSGGRLFRSAYSEDAGQITFDVLAYEEYELFVLANTGRQEFPVTLEEMQDLRYEIQAVQDICAGGGLPMYGHRTLGVTSDGRVSVPMRRMTAEISLEFMPAAGLEVNIRSVRLENAPSDMNVFRDMSVPSRRSPGDYTTGDDPDRIMSGNGCRFYMLEDMSSDNETPSSSGNPGTTDIPDDRPYMLVKGTVTNSAGLVTAEIDYRLVLDWKIRRNHRYVIPFRATENGIYEESYRVEVYDAELEMPEDDIEIPVGGEYLLDIPAAEYSDLIYTSGDTHVLTVDGSGRLKGVAPGRTVVTVSCPALSASAECQVEVYRMSDLTGFYYDEIKYAGQWSMIALYSASPDNPVNVTLGDRTVAVGQDVTSSQGYEHVSSGGVELYYIPRAGKDRIYVYCRHVPEDVRIGLLQDRRYAEVRFDAVQCPEYGFHTNAGRNEIDTYDDARGNTFYLYLYDVRNNSLNLDRFMIPDDVCEATGMQPQDALVENYVAGMELAGDAGYEEYLRVSDIEYMWESTSNCLMKGQVYGLKTDRDGVKELSLILRNTAEGYAGVMQEEEISCIIRPLFERQGHCGDIYNYQIAPVSLQSDVSGVGIPFIQGAEWEIRRYYPDENEGRTLDEIWENADTRFTSMVEGPQIENGVHGSALRFMEPSRLDKDEFYTNGSYIFKGSFTNTKNGHVATGLYTVDIILYVSVLCHVDMRIEGNNLTRVYWGYVPLSRWSRPGYRDFWSNMYAAPIYDITTGRICKADGNVSLTPVGSFVTSGEYQEVNAAIIALKNMLNKNFGTNGVKGFQFVTPSGGYANELRINRDNFRDAGAEGYYHFVRQTDRHGTWDGTDYIDNCVIELYYKDFENY